jgi:dolichol-phosphate mannosyltransferase
MLVVDDTSPDGTGQALELLAKECKNLKVIRRHKKLGLGTAYIAGFKEVLRGNYDYCIAMDGDFSHNPRYIKQLLDTIPGCDMVVGSRFLNGIHIINWSFFRLCISIFAIRYVQLVTGLTFSDPLSGYRCFSRNVLEFIATDSVTSKGFFFQTEVLYRAYKSGFRIQEIPVSFIDRTLGKSKLSLEIILEALSKAFLMRFRYK